MSRFSYAEYDGEGPPPEFWWQAVKNATRGKHGQAVLRELREALLSLPEQRLIEGAVVKDGEVCAMGALAAHRLKSGPLILRLGYLGKCGEEIKSLEELESRFGEWLVDDDGTCDLGMEMGLVRTLAWVIAWENDDAENEIVYRRTVAETPEQRYERVLRWVEKQIV